MNRSSRSCVRPKAEWFGEWARKARGEQRGLLLLTAHRAKGLEFDYVAILNGDWDPPSRNEDVDAPRRLFYIAMTRAKYSLTLLSDGHRTCARRIADCGGHHDHIQGNRPLRGGPLHRPHP